MRLYRVNFRSLAAVNRAAATSLNKDKAVRVHKVFLEKKKFRQEKAHTFLTHKLFEKAVNP